MDKKQPQVVYFNEENRQLNPVKFVTGECCKMIKVEGRSVEILALTGDDPFYFDFQHDKNINQYYWLENKRIIHSFVLEKAKTNTIFIPRGYHNGNIAFSSLLPQYVTLPINGLIDPLNYDPLKLFFMTPTGAVPSLTIHLRDDFALRGFPMDDASNGNLMFAQELFSFYGLKEGFVDISNLSDQQCFDLVKEIVGEDHINALDRDKIEADGIWTTAKIAKDVTKAGYRLFAARRILMDFGFKGRFYYIVTKGRQYVIFKGYSGLRKWYTGTRLRVTNPKIISITYAGGARQIFKSGFSKGTTFSIVVAGGAELYEWMSKPENEREIGELLGGLGFEALSAFATVVITTGIMPALIKFGSLAFMGTIPVSGVIVGAIAVSFLIGTGITWLSNKYGWKERFKECGKQAEDFLGNLYEEYFYYPLLNLYYQLEITIINMYYRGY